MEDYSWLPKFLKYMLDSLTQVAAAGGGRVLRGGGRLAETLHSRLQRLRLLPGTCNMWRYYGRDGAGGCSTIVHGREGDPRIPT